jgi:hypothetical protein
MTNSINFYSSFLILDVQICRHLLLQFSFKKEQNKKKYEQEQWVQQLEDKDTIQ